MTIERRAPAEMEATRRHLRRDLRGLDFLESAQRIVAIAALVAIALHAIVHSDDAVTTISLTTLVLLAISLLALAFRIRRGAELVRRDLWLLDAADDLDVDARVHPYRSPSTKTVRLPEQSGRGSGLQHRRRVPTLEA